MTHFLASLGAAAQAWLARVGVSFLFFVRVVRFSKLTVQRLSLLSKEIYDSGVLSLAIIIVSGAFVGMVLALQGYYTLKRFGAADSVGIILALSVVRELGPVVSALLFAARSGSSMTAAIGMMKAREELVAMEMMGVNPIARVVAPRFWSGVISLPILSLVFCSASILGGFYLAIHVLSIDGGTFWSLMRDKVSFTADVLNGVIKSIVFAVVISWIAVYQGFFCQPTVAGVASATTRTVVISSLMVLFVDFMLTAVMFNFT